MKRILAIAAVAVLTLGAFLVFNPKGASVPGISAAEAQEATSEQLAMVPDMVLGDAAAPVTLTEYASFTCPHCMRFHTDVFPLLKAEYIDTGKVRLVYREVYFDRFGLWAGMMARCGGPDKYFGIVKMIYDTQPEWIGDQQDGTVAENLRKMGLVAGIGADELDSCMSDGAMAEAMVATYQTNATADGVNSTPTFVIGGAARKNMPYEDLKVLIEAELGN